MDIYIAQMSYEDNNWTNVAASAMRSSIKEAIHDAFCAAVTDYPDARYRVVKLEVVQIGSELSQSEVIKFNAVLQR